MGSPQRLLGLDPGLRFMGWGLIEAQNNRLTHIANGTIATSSKASLAHRLVELEAGLENILTSYQPHEVAVENTFVNRDGAASLKLGQARAICLLVPARHQIPISEYAPNMIKKTVAGAGHADKQQMQTMMQMLLPQAKPDSEHATDALAVAIAHAHMAGQQKRVEAALKKQQERAS